MNSAIDLSESPAGFLSGADVEAGRTGQGGPAGLREYLLQNGASHAARDARGRTPLHYALLYDCVDAAKSLLSRGANKCVPLPKPLRPSFVLTTLALVVLDCMLGRGLPRPLGRARVFFPVWLTPYNIFLDILSVHAYKCP